MIPPNKENRYFKMVRQFKEYIITEELIKHNWNICATARSFGLHRNSLTRHIAELGIENKRQHGNKNTVAAIDRRAESITIIPSREASGDGSISTD